MAHRPIRLDLAEPLLQRVAVMPQAPAPINPLAENVDILRAAERRVASLEAGLKEKESQLDSARLDIEELQVGAPCTCSVVQFMCYTSCCCDIISSLKYPCPLYAFECMQQADRNSASHYELQQPQKTACNTHSKSVGVCRMR